MPAKQNLIFILLIVALVFITYYGSFTNAFIWDDRAFVTENQAIRNLNFKTIASYFTDRHTTSPRPRLSQQVWRPLVTTSFAVDYSLWKLDPRPYHIENAFIHAFNSVLVYIVTALIVGNALTAFLAALIFAVHPIQTQAVTLISGRANVLFLLFFLLSFIFHIKSRTVKEPTLNYVLCLIFFAFSLLSKEMAITLPLVCVLYDAHFFDKKPLRDYELYYFPFFLTALVYFIARTAVLGCVAQRELMAGGNIAAIIFTMLKVMASYIRLLFFPVNLRAEYLVSISTSIFNKDVIISCCFLLCIIAAYIILRRDKAVSFYIFWFFITLIPVSNLIPINTFMDERFLYLPSIAFAAILSMAFFGLLNRTRLDLVKILLAVVLITIMVFYETATIRRNAEMRNELTFCVKEVQRSPKNAIFHYNLGNEYVRKREYELAIQEYENSLSLRPDNQWAYINLADVYKKTGSYDKAIENYQKAIALPQRDEYTHAAYEGLKDAYAKKEGKK